MKFLLTGLFNTFDLLDTIVKSVKTADENNFWGFLTSDHLVFPHQMGDSGTVEVWTLLSYLSALTEKIRLGTLVTPMPLRPPQILAKVVSSLDILSNGRSILGVGAGYVREEFEAYYQWDDPKTRVDKTYEAVEMITQLWTRDVVNYCGKHYSTKNTILEPKPIQRPHPPLLFGSMGSGKRMLKLAGKYSDICYIPSFQTKTFGFDEAREIVMSEARIHKREEKVAIATGASYSAEKFPHFGSEYVERNYIKGIEEATQLGCEYVLVPFPTKSFVVDLTNFCRDVLPSFSY